jgi:hypothetical protein
MYGVDTSTQEQRDAFIGRVRKRLSRV